MNSSHQTYKAMAGVSRFTGNAGAEGAFGYDLPRPVKI